MAIFPALQKLTHIRIDVLNTRLKQIVGAWESGSEEMERQRGNQEDGRTIDREE